MQNSLLSSTEKSFLNLKTELAPMRVALEIGHGYRVVDGVKRFDPGAVGPTGLSEYRACFDIGSYAKRILEDLGFEADMIFKPVTLAERGRLGAGYDLFVSLHLNSFQEPAGRPQVQGTETWILPIHSAGDELLATSLQNSLVTKLRLNDRGVKTGKLLVLSTVPKEVPARCLVEPFFIDACQTAREVEELGKIAAEGIADGILHYSQGGQH